MEKTQAKPRNASTSCNFLENKMSRIKRTLEDARTQNNPEIDLVEKNVTSFEELHGLSKFNTHPSFFLKTFGSAAKFGMAIFSSGTEGEPVAFSPPNPLPNVFLKGF